MDINYYITYDLPVPYKNIKIYPVMVKDYLYFSSYSDCLSFEKNVIPDAKIISMTNLEYVYHLAQKKDEGKLLYLMWFDRILSICLKDEKTFENIETSLKRYKYDDESGKPVFVINETVYTSQDFDEIRKIICRQNLVELPDTSISKEVRDSLEKAKEYKNKIANVKYGSFEDYIISLATVTGWTYEYIYSMSARKFIKSIRRLDNFIHYKIYLTASMSGMVKFEDKSFIKHWLTDIENENKYADVSVDLDAVQKKISLESAKT